MDPLRAIAPPHRAVAVALAASAVLHGAALVGFRVPDGEDANLDAPEYRATLEPAVIAEPGPAPAAPSVPKPRARTKKSAPSAEETIAVLPAAIEAADLPPPEPEPAPQPELVALAQPAVPIALPELPLFRPDALPAEVSIKYLVTSAIVEGEAEYRWKRDGDRYEITGSAQASGFFTLFLEGRVDQTASGSVTPQGLRPERFTERLGNAPEEGLVFDWAAGKVEFRRSDSTRTGPLTDSTVDWLSMIFQLAHMPPKGHSMELRVYTQRRLYQYHLEVMGFEELLLPFGRANTLHLHHAGDKPEDAVDVWLGVDQYYLPVKLRYPVARNRLMVEQTATSVKARSP